ncbi:neutral zinc metallopeptidase [Vannielia litorea]|uniref:KPN_02809 family neutral zinc metallopeptidase n=1 Tax=Vannielia litorea TaxID=1217970 RepID=UPI001C9457FC|nr:neutral zinc metallopeptidase [Vannielia litorea]MBY6152709.1 neutral zinc metallopeptidase [Vannielia litorea]
MKWRGRRGSRNVIDRRGVSAGKAGGIGGVGLIIVLVVGYFLGIDVTPLLNGGGVPVQSTKTRELSAEEQAAGQFVSVVLADTEEIWGRVFPEQVGRAYRPAQLVLFSGRVASGCGGASAATGPFYCPADRRAYLDTQFFATLQNRLGAKGDFAAAYVVAHEIAHHVQNELGILSQVNEAKAAAGEQRRNELSVRTELQADCLSGVWAHYAEAQLGTVEPGDLDEALNAARQIGDDTLQRNAGRTPMPHTFTHGSAAQRQEWFARGYESGRMDACDTFGTSRL